MVTSATPANPVAGVIVTERLPPVPLNTMFAFGNTAVSEELAAKVKFAAGVSGSLTVNGMGPVEVFTGTIRLVMDEINGNRLTVTEKVREIVIPDP